MLLKRPSVFIFNLIFFLYFVSANFSYGKNTHFPGYVITLTHDTLVGYIEYKNREKNPRHILFKETLNDSGIYFTPKSITEFRAAGVVYKSAIVKNDQSPYKTNELTLSPDFQFIIDTVFLQAIILGEKELYYLKDSTGKESFYIKQDSVYEWLIYKKYQKKEKDKKLIVVNNNYIGQLLLYMQNCRSINSVLSITTYDLKSLSKVFNYYYECTNTKVVYRVKEKKLKLYFWLK